MPLMKIGAPNFSAWRESWSIVASPDAPRNA
jgi:hypothetical protein